jgi:divinyl chlorophyllide a 8-vinyl-reductase
VAAAGGARSVPAKRVFVLGGTGTIGHATVQSLIAHGHHVTSFGRAGCTRQGDVTSASSLAQDGFGGEQFDVLISCLASRNGTPADAWAIDHAAHVAALSAAKAAGVKHFVLLSAICVQKPRLAFQHAKLAFEKTLVASGVTWTIVRPTAYFKSLSGQVARVQAGKPFLLFGDGMLTACKPISDTDLADYITGCIEDETRHNKILSIGGPGPAISPREQGEMLFQLLGKPPKYCQVPVVLMTIIIRLLTIAGRFSRRAKAKSELAKIGRYYATESMLVWDEKQGRYDADATPETGRETLRDHYRDLIAGKVRSERGEHAVF